MKLIELLTREIRSSADYNPNVQVAPSAILWTDKKRQWESALPLLQSVMPELIVLGEYQPQSKTGPAIWIKCAIEGVLPGFELPVDRTPIVYLPGVERRDLRAIVDCPPELMPLAELQYRGCWWIYNNSGRDWTVRAFMVSDNGGAGLDVAGDDKTQQTLLRVLPEILDSHHQDLLNRRLEVADFNRLVSSDPVRDLLSWMNDPAACRKRWDSNRWQALVGICESEYRFNPEHDGEHTAAELLCARQGLWEGVWQRYLDSCQQYPQLPQLLLQVEADLAANGESYPVVNQRGESELENALQKLLSQDASSVRNELVQLEEWHAVRLSWVWHDLGLAPLAGVIKHLAAVAKLSMAAFSGSQPEDMAEQYRNVYWRSDDQLLKALACNLSASQQSLVQSILGMIYSPWLDEVTRNFQNLVQQRGYPGTSEINEATANYAAAAEVIFFVDGLRYDLAQRLHLRLQALGEIQLSSNWAALPSVTATAKAAITPVHDRLSLQSSNRDFVPSLEGDEGTSFSTHYLRKFLQEKGWQYLEDGEPGNPASNAWVQNGDIDKEGHVRGVKLAARVDVLLDEIVERIEELVAAGWRKIRIVTDHGWMLTPEPMPKVELPKHLTETRWGRCAVIKDSVTVGFQQYSWHWNKTVSVAMAPGAACFRAGLHYDHGGLSLQECLTPVLELKPIHQVTTSSVSAELSELRWLGLRCRVRAKTDASGVIAVLRTRPADAESEICSRKPLKDGQCSLVVDDEHEGVSAVLVLLDEQGNILTRRPTLVGEN